MLENFIETEDVAPAMVYQYEGNNCTELYLI